MVWSLELLHIFFHLIERVPVTNVNCRKIPERQHFAQNPFYFRIIYRLFESNNKTFKNTFWGDFRSFSTHHHSIAFHRIYRNFEISYILHAHSHTYTNPFYSSFQSNFPLLLEFNIVHTLCLCISDCSLMQHSAVIRISEIGSGLTYVSISMFHFILLNFQSLATISPLFIFLFYLET